jgi:16S rRNA (adenine1518-N6/adenine1519-N6)-dimethyltransferase
MKLSEMKQILAEGNIQLTKSLGQNFLHDANQLRRIVAAAELSPNDRVLEIGPGLGPLTELLLAGSKEVLAIEKDARLAGFLRERFSSAGNLTLLHEDALDYLRRQPDTWADWKLVANLPYSVGSRLLVELASATTGPKLKVVTLQLEVARRLLAHPRDEDYGVLTLLVQLQYEAGGTFKIPASCFFPEPDVDSACVKMVRRSEPLLSPKQAEVFRQIVKRSFSQRRKMMFKLLKQDWPGEALELGFRQAGLSSDARAETISLEGFVKLTQCLSMNAKSKP